MSGKPTRLQYRRLCHEVEKIHGIIDKLLKYGREMIEQRDKQTGIHTYNGDASQIVEGAQFGKIPLKDINDAIEKYKTILEAKKIELSEAMFALGWDGKSGNDARHLN